jgi:hypothetical protein
MVGKLRISVYILVIFFPVATYILGMVNQSNGLVWLALDTGYYYPVYLIAASLFEKLEMGLLMPSMGGRFLAIVLYPLLLFFLFRVADGISARR